jgi:hypothetical protein
MEEVPRVDVGCKQTVQFKSVSNSSSDLPAIQVPDCAQDVSLIPAKWTGKMPSHSRHRSCREVTRVEVMGIDIESNHMKEVPRVDVGCKQTVQFEFVSDSSSDLPAIQVPDCTQDVLLIPEKLTGKMPSHSRHRSCREVTRVEVTGIDIKSNRIEEVPRVDVGCKQTVQFEYVSDSSSDLPATQVSDSAQDISLIPVSSHLFD